MTRTVLYIAATAVGGYLGVSIAVAACIGQAIQRLNNVAPSARSAARSSATPIDHFARWESELIDL